MSRMTKLKKKAYDASFLEDNLFIEEIERLYWELQRQPRQIPVESQEYFDRTGVYW